MARALIPAVVLGVVLGFGFAERTAEAGVKGKTYNVTVTKNLAREFTDFYSFQSDGKFISARGGIGSWSQTNLLLFSIWTCDFQASPTIKVSFIGVQVGPSIKAFGSNDEADIFQTVGTEGPYNGSIGDDTNYYITD
uniref:Uncharacterized protein n=1 Tax=Schlesneria paludicola TaxID=360056 RepID=A0A7C2PAV1_9PLAN